MSNPIVALAGVSKSYGAFDALKDINVAVSPGSVLCVLFTISIMARLR